MSSVHECVSVCVCTFEHFTGEKRNGAEKEKYVPRQINFFTYVSTLSYSIPISEEIGDPWG